jgi:hypothetical protein
MGASPDDELLTVDEVADRLGLSVRPFADDAPGADRSSKGGKELAHRGVGPTGSPAESGPEATRIGIVAGRSDPCPRATALA